MNGRFSEYVTSGAFHMALSRPQIASLSQAVGGERFIASAAALERKGLIAPVLDQHDDFDPPGFDRTEWRLTAAGTLALALLYAAGLTNSGVDALAAEIEHLRKALDDARRVALDARVRMRSMHAKLQKAEDALANQRARATGDKLTVTIGLRDPLPDIAAEDLLDSTHERTGL